jgi:hypothetical protein
MHPVVIARQLVKRHPGDVFLFLGWFAHVREDGTGRLRYARGGRGFQAIAHRAT